MKEFYKQLDLYERLKIAARECGTVLAVWYNGEEHIEVIHEMNLEENPTRFAKELEDIKSEFSKELGQEVSVRINFRVTDFRKAIDTERGIIYLTETYGRLVFKEVSEQYKNDDNKEVDLLASSLYNSVYINILGETDEVQTEVAKEVAELLFISEPELNINFRLQDIPQHSLAEVETSDKYIKYELKQILEVLEEKVLAVCAYGLTNMYVYLGNNEETFKYMATLEYGEVFEKVFKCLETERRYVMVSEISTGRLQEEERAGGVVVWRKDLRDD